MSEPKQQINCEKHHLSQISPNSLIDQRCRLSIITKCVSLSHAVCGCWSTLSSVSINTRTHTLSLSLCYLAFFPHFSVLFISLLCDCVCINWNTDFTVLGCSHFIGRTNTKYQWGPKPEIQIFRSSTFVGSLAPSWQMLLKFNLQGCLFYLKTLNPPFQTNQTKIQWLFLFITQRSKSSSLFYSPWPQGAKKGMSHPLRTKTNRGDSFGKTDYFWLRASHSRPDPTHKWLVRS